MNATIVYDVPPTDRTQDGPIWLSHNGNLVLDYDCQHDDGSLTWSRLVFSNVLAVDFRQATCCRSEDIISATEMRAVQDSTWLFYVLKLWQESVGWQEWQQKLGGALRFRHYTAFFDEAGSMNVVASDCTISHLSQGSPLAALARGSKWGRV
jgi:hypothetical protein